MSKPSSGHFSGTVGSELSFRNLSQDNRQHAIIHSSEYDEKEHPTKYKQLSSKKLKELRIKEANRTITKSEYKRKEWQRRLDARRRAGINAFWDREKELIRHGKRTTRNWSASQISDILSNKRPKHKGVSLQSHHTYSVAKYPHLANVSELIYPVTRLEHQKRWHGNNYRTSLPGIPKNPTIKEEF